MIKKYSRKSPPVEAVQWLGNNWEEIRTWVENKGNLKFHPLYRWNESDPESPILVRTIDGEMRVSVGDWIIRTEFGEYVPCRNSTFSREYSSEDDYVEIVMEDSL